MSDWDEATADWYAGSHGDDPGIFAVVEAAEIPARAAVLDIGCGTGSGLRRLVGHAGALTGVDPTPRMIDHARRQTPAGGVEYHVAGAESLPVADNSQDVVLAINSVHHWHDQAQGLAEAFRVLCPGGRLVMGGEVFDAAMGVDQDHGAALARAGFHGVATRDIPHGFVTVGHKPEDPLA